MAGMTHHVRPCLDQLQLHSGWPSVPHAIGLQMIWLTRSDATAVLDAAVATIAVSAPLPVPATATTFSPMAI